MSIETLPLTSLGAAAAAVIEKIEPKIIRHEDGIYFGLPEDSYYRDDALGSTDLKHLLLSGADYWYYSLHNPHRPEDDETKARRNGHALHTCILFGRDEFDRRYACEARKEDYPEALVTMDDMRKALKSAGMKATAKSKDELAERIRSEAPYLQLWDDIVAGQKIGGRKLLKYDDYWRIVTAADAIHANPELNGCFTNGAPEVSVFWTQDGIRFRARFDYLRLYAVIDLKSFTNVMRKPIELAINSAIYNHAYDVQASHYLNARHIARGFIKSGRVFGDIDRDWLNRVAEQDEYVFTFVFHSLNGAPISEAVDVIPGSLPEGAASVDIERAVARFREYKAAYGDGPWFHMAKRRTLTDDAIPAWHRTAA